MDFIASLAFLAMIICIIMIVVYGIKSINNKNGKSRNRLKKVSIGLAISFIIMIIAASFTDDGNRENKESKSKTHRSIKKQSNSKEKEDINKKKAAEKAKSESESKASSKSDKETIDNNKRRNIKDFKSALTKIPNQTKEAITSATYESGSDSGGFGTVDLTLSDDLLGVSDSQLKEVSKGAWNGTMNIINQYSPYPDNEQPTYVNIKDNTGNDIATTSAFGSFKFQE